MPEPRLVPVLVYVRRLARSMRMQRRQGKLISSNLVREYLISEYTGRRRDMLLQAYEMRTLIVLLDGIDEASGLKEELEDFVLSSLAPMRLRLVATSRPEGIRLNEMPQLYTGWVVMNLSGLDAGQQRQAIDAQLLQSQDEAVREFAKHVMAVGQIRAEHDAKYRAELFDPSERAHIESLSSPDLVRAPPDSLRKADLLDGMWYNPAMRQMTLNGLMLEEMAEGGGELHGRLQSNTCRMLIADPLFSDVTLAKAQELVEKAIKAGSALTDTMLTAAVGEWSSKLVSKASTSPLKMIPGVRKGTEKAPKRELPLKLLKALCSLAFNHRTFKVNEQRYSNASAEERPRLVQRVETLNLRAATVKSLWLTILRRTDQLYCTAEAMEPAFKQVAAMMMEEAQIPKEMLKIGTLKDPVRVYEKAMSDYYFRFGDGLPEACVLDMLRCRMEAVSAKTLFDFVAMIYKTSEGSKEFKVDKDGKSVTASLRLIRSKNKHSTLDPTHFRHFNFVLQLSIGEARCFIEMQVRDVMDAFLAASPAVCMSTASIHSSLRPSQLFLTRLSPARAVAPSGHPRAQRET